ncbi:hypothetical protein PHMEG_00028437 [Phytophthora megakarya]|uniref:CCHC-type domain-containing protein n=1 Tax=Phytophthora megakarya TaxID=4795 RepID=A0A225V5J8_9STRA|nr:hypothetical protein PHMEG_00028437 [Phytophthora megakarya]
MREEFSLWQAKLHVNVPLPPEPAVEMVDGAEGPEPMDLSNASAAGQQETRTNVRRFRCENIGHYARECTTPVHLVQGRRGDTGYRHGRTNNAMGQHACLQRTRGMETAGPSEREYLCKVQYDKPIIVILKMTSMTKRADSLRVLADSDVSSNLFDSNRHVPKSPLEVRLATGAIVKTEKRVIRARLSYNTRCFVKGLLVLDLDDKLDMVLGMP